jgi:adenylylsulfate kinase
MCEEHEGFTLWFTGLPCSGKSAVGDRVAAILKDKGLRVERLDGDVVRQDLEMRDRARTETTNFVEVYAKCSLEVCMQRDVKGMYQKALRGEIKEFTGVSDPYEEPLNAEIVIETDKETVDESVQNVLRRLTELGLL